MSSLDGFFDRMEAFQPEHVLPIASPGSHLRGWLVIDNTHRGPAFGGIRLGTYRNPLNALEDALRLARAMTWKAAFAGLPCGGGKIVVFRFDPRRRKDLFQALGRTIESLNGRYYAGPDMGVNPSDLAVMGETTRYVGCGSGSSQISYGKWTAISVMESLTAALESVFSLPVPWTRIHVLLQGLGRVGWEIATLLHERGCHLTVTDIDPNRATSAIESFHCDAIHPDAVGSTRTDVFIPCATGGILNETTAQRIPCRIVCGSANNILENDETAEVLHRRGVLVIPDFVANAGALIAGALRYFRNATDTDILDAIQRVRTKTAALLERSRSTHHSPFKLAVAEAERMLSFPHLSDTTQDS